VRLFVESNFVLELALCQEERRACEQLLQLAESGQVQIHIPAYCLGEPFERLTRSHRSRMELHARLKDEAAAWRRSPRDLAFAEAGKSMMQTLVASIEREAADLDLVLQRVAAASSIVPLDADVVARATAIRAEGLLKPQDAIVLASVQACLAGWAPGPSLFLNRNGRDFGVPEVRSRLRAWQCEVILNFEDGLARVLAGLRRAD
jgi:predicted nucleic acid-binding protein